MAERAVRWTRATLWLALTGAGCGDDPEFVDVAQHDPECAGLSTFEERMCGDSPVALAVEPLEDDRQALFVGTGHHVLHRLGGWSDTGGFVGDALSVGTAFSRYSFLFCDFTGVPPDDLLLLDGGANDEKRDQATLLSHGSLTDDTASKRPPLDYLEGVQCADVDEDGASDLVGIGSDAALVVFPGGIDRWPYDRVSIDVGFSPPGRDAKADAQGLAGCGRAIYAVSSAALGASLVTLVAFDPVGKMLSGSSLDVGGDVVEIRFDALDDGTPLLIVATGGARPRLAVYFQTARCGLTLQPLGYAYFGEIRKVHRVQGDAVDLLVVGDETDGVQLLEVTLQGGINVLRTWDIAPVDAAIVQFDAESPRELISAIPEPPYLERLPL